MSITLIIIAIFFSVISALAPFNIKKLSINIITGPLLTLAALYALQIIDLQTIRLGILGNAQLRPWEILIIFLTTAYVSISVDVTGILDFFA